MLDCWSEYIDFLSCPKEMLRRFCTYPRRHRLFDMETNGEGHPRTREAVGHNDRYNLGLAEDTELGF